jgi:hypothetical protein
MPEREITEMQREEMRARILGAIFPNTPRTLAEQAAFEQAVNFQILHEMDQATDLPKGAKSVRIGHYSVEMADSGAGDLLTPRRLCGAAYGVLLYAGLLYKGVERS